MMKMHSNVITFDKIKLTVTPLEDGLFALAFSIETEGGYGKPKELAIVADTKNECVVTGKMTNMLLYCLKGRREENK